MPIWERLLNLFLLLVIFAIVFILPIYLVLFGGMRKFALRPLQRCFEDIELREQPLKGDVVFTYHTYRGLLLWFTQQEIAGYTTPDEARTLLKRLLKFNLTWGMLSCGLLFIPFLAIGNYKAQMKSIRIQSESKGASHEMGNEDIGE